MKKKDPTSHRIIEKRRRDRMNNCLADLSKLIPAHYMKKGRGRVEKTEIIESAIKHLKDLIEFTNAQQLQHQHQCASQHHHHHQQQPTPLPTQQQQPLQLQPPQNNQQHPQIHQHQHHQQSQSQVTTTATTNGVINSLVPTSSSNTNNHDKSECVSGCNNKIQPPSTSSARQHVIMPTTATVFEQEDLQQFPNHQENQHRDSCYMNCNHHNSCATNNKNHDKIHRSSPSSSGSGSDSSSSSSSRSSSSSSSLSSLSSNGSLNGSSGCCTCDSSLLSNSGSNSSRLSFNSNNTCNSSHQSTTAWYKKAWLVRSFSRSPQR